MPQVPARRARTTAAASILRKPQVPRQAPRHIRRGSKRQRRLDRLRVSRPRPLRPRAMLRPHRLDRREERPSPDRLVEMRKGERRLRLDLARRHSRQPRKARNQGVVQRRLWQQAIHDKHLRRGVGRLRADTLRARVRTGVEELLPCARRALQGACGPLRDMERSERQGILAAQGPERDGVRTTRRNHGQGNPRGAAIRKVRRMRDELPDAVPRRVQTCRRPRPSGLLLVPPLRPASRIGLAGPREMAAPLLPRRRPRRERRRNLAGRERLRFVDAQEILAAAHHPRKRARSGRLAPASLCAGLLVRHPALLVFPDRRHDEKRLSDGELGAERVQGRATGCAKWPHIHA